MQSDKQEILVREAEIIGEHWERMTKKLAKYRDNQPGSEDNNLLGDVAALHLDVDGFFAVLERDLREDILNVVNGQK